MAAEKEQITLRIIVEADDFDNFVKKADSSLSEFSNSFEHVIERNNLTFFKYISDQKRELETTANFFDKLYQPESSFGKLVKRLAQTVSVGPGPRGTVSIGITPEGVIDVSVLSKRTVVDVYDWIKEQFDESVEVDVPVQPIPFFTPHKPMPVEGGFSALGRLLLEQEMKKGRTIEEIAHSYRDELQSRLNDEFGLFRDLEIPTLNINYPDVKLKDLPSAGIENGTNEHIKAFYTLQLTLQNLKEQYDKTRESMKAGSFAINDSTDSHEQLRTTISNLIQNMDKEAVVFGYTTEELLGIGSAAGEALKSTENLGKDGIKAVADQAKQAEPKLDSLSSSTEGIKETAETLDKTLKDGKGAITGYGTEAQSTADKGLTDLEGKIEDVDNAASNLDLKEAAKGLNVTGMNEIIPGLPFPTKKINEDIVAVADTFEETSKNAQVSLDELGVFASDIAAEINNTFADLIFRSFKGDFDNMKDFWKSTLDAMLMAFSQFIATVISNPIRIGLQAFLSGTSAQAAGGKSGSGGQDAVQTAQAGLGLFGSGLGESFRSLGSLVLGEFSGMTGLLGTVQAALPAIGTILAAAAIAIPIISGLLKKTPRLDIDFDSVKTEVGRRAALVEEFLDPEFFMENIGQVSVKRGGVGVGAGGSDKILELIQQRIQETIEGIQDIIRRLPVDIFNTLNETLLNAEIDIDTEIAGERLLEFDAKGKKIAEKFQAFIEGELPAKFFAAIRDSFFAPAFQALGVSAEGTQQLIDDFMAKMEAAGSREERAAIGQEFLDTFGAFVDAFNIVSGNVNDSIGQTIRTEECEYRLAA